MLSQLLGLLFAVGAEGGIGGEAGGRGHGGVVGYCVGIDGPGHAHLWLLISTLYLLRGRVDCVRHA